MSPFNFITLKKIIYAANVSEDDATTGNDEYTKVVKEYAQNEGSKVIVMCAKLEEELSGLEDEEKNAFMAELGIDSSGLDKLIKATYDLLYIR